jgi:hypothetical protein
LKNRGDTGADYLTARIARDRPDIIERMKVDQQTRERVRLAAEATTGETLPRGGDKKSEEWKSIGKLPIDRQPARAASNGISERSQRKLDRLARDFPEQHERVKAGEVSVNRACIEVGIARRMLSIPVDDPEPAIRLIVKHFKGRRPLPIRPKFAFRPAYAIRPKSAIIADIGHDVRSGHHPGDRRETLTPCGRIHATKR